VPSGMTLTRTPATPSSRVEPPGTVGRPNPSCFGGPRLRLASPLRREDVALRMWQGHVEALARYALECCQTWGQQGYAETCAHTIAASARVSASPRSAPRTSSPPGVRCLPRLFGDEDFHRSHRRRCSARIRTATSRCSSVRCTWRTTCPTPARPRLRRRRAPPRACARLTSGTASCTVPRAHRVWTS
jgi:hypothetical protein